MLPPPALGGATPDADTNPMPAPAAIPPKPQGYGPYPVGWVDVQIPRHANVDVAARIYYPAPSFGLNVTPNTAGGPWPVIVFIPGGMDTLGYCNGITSTMATQGFIVVNVELGNSYGGGLRNPYTMANETTDVLNWLKTQNANASFLLNQTMNLARLGVSGHSWGGAASGLAVTTKYGDPRFKAAAPISSTPFSSPTDYSKDIHVPLMLMAGTNGDNNLKPLLDASNPPATNIVVIGADHGGVLSYAEWPVSFFRYWLRNETDYEHWVYLDGVRTDANITFTSNLFRAWGNLSSRSVPEDTNVTYTAGVEGRTFGAINYKWDFNGDWVFDWASNVTNMTEKTWTHKGQYTQRLRVSDNYETKDIQIILNVTNVPPVAVITAANAYGEPLRLSEDEQFNVSAKLSRDTPTDNSTLQFKWNFGDGNSTDYSANRDASHTFKGAGIYCVTLSVKDNDSAVSNATLTVNVSNTPPAVMPGENAYADEDKAVALTGTGSDTASDMAAGLSYRWEYGDGRSAEWDRSPDTTHIYTASGNYTARLFVRDVDGSVSNGTLIVHVRNLAPTAAVTGPADGDSFQKDDEVQFTGTGDDTPSDRAGLLLRWDFGDGNGTEWAPAAPVSHTYHKGGTFRVTLSVKDSDGNVTSAAISLKVDNAPPTVSILAPLGETAVNEDKSVHFSASASDTPSDQDTLSITWEMDGALYRSAEADHLFTRSGSFPAKVTVTDPEGATASATVTITVKNKAPLATASLEPAGVLVGQKVNLTGSATDTPSDMSNLTFSWLFDDGTPEIRARNATHNFSKSGTHIVRFVVTDDDGASAELELAVTVSDPPPPPVKPVTPGGGGVPVSTLAAAGGAVAAIIAVLLALLLLKRRGKRQAISETSESPVESAGRVEERPPPESGPATPP